MQNGGGSQSASGAVAASGSEGMELRESLPKVLAGGPGGGVEALSEGHATSEGSAESAKRLRNGASGASGMHAESQREETKHAEHPVSKPGAPSAALPPPPKAAQEAPPAGGAQAEPEKPHPLPEKGGPSSPAPTPQTESEPEHQKPGGASGPSSTPRNVSELTESLLAIEKDAQMVDVADVLSQLVTACTPIAQYKQLTLEHVGPPPGALPLVAAEPHAVRQVLSIVLDNALRYTQRGGWVRCELVDASGAGVFMRVEDDGPGMNLLAQAQAFVPTPEVQLTSGGGQLPAQLESQRQSSGLSIARDLVEIMGGVMRIRSPRVADAPVGHWGTNVEIWLPTGKEKEGETGEGDPVLAGSSSGQVCE
ncbi:hypothetical protein KFL_001730080 [Klebsormidium nitens]|uniref:Histidine kinase domain-containing protein n=1 Tax=Klebsormidium nitens TaxID=105231 RepID=A0A1Y1HZD2_KLENI|nr:hypothetical protein KFL_001730080 [Klebsormidium nitens]|eukprot:GAQ84014.1 hypothetical protein KFL_001730080 [Klebsormidium nitens]